MRLHVHEWGDASAAPLVCLHGVGGHGRRFRKLAEERLAAGHRVLAPDLRGHGRSGHDEPWTLEAHVE
ncbi:MAG: alpha/beta fold hydrolase, partial [Gaiellaceae bacterium]